MIMEDKDLEKLFASMDIPAPDTERRKETLNLAVAEFEAQKSAKNQKNMVNAQGLSWWSRLTSQNSNSERKNNMTGSNKRFIYGGLATACIALMVGGSYLVTQSTRSGGGSTEREKNITLADNQTGNQFNRIVDNMETSSILEGLNKIMPPSTVSEAPGSSELSQTMRESIEERNIANVEQAARSGGSAMPVPTQPSKGALPMPVEQLAQADSLERWRRMQPPEAKSRAEATGVAVAPMASIAPAPMAADAFAPVMEVEGRDKFESVEQNSIKQVKAEPMSTFSIDVDTSSYSFVRQSLDNGLLPQKDSVRVEEMINYFDYAYPLPSSKEEPFSTNVVVKDSPWNEGKKLITIGIKGYDMEKTAQPASNLVFLLDTSGSMNEPKKLPLLKQSLSMLLDTLKPTDKVSIVVYAGSAGTVLQPTEVSKKNEIIQALNNLSAGGSTAGGEGIRMAYELAQANFDKDAINRVILATDGDFNVGITNPEELKGFVEREREKGIFLSVLGFGTGNYNDAMMQQLAQNGNGIAAYIDTLNEARKVLVQEASKALFPIAKDVKIQVEFNPSTVFEYRLVGYETRALNTEDFNNDKVDAGDIGAGSEVTAIYEVTPVGGTPAIDASRYDDKPPVGHPDHEETELAFVKVRYKLPDENTSKLITTPVQIDQQADETLRRETGWAEAVAGFGQLLKGGKYTGALTYDDVLKQAEANKGNDPFGYRAEFITLIHKAKTAASMPAQNNGGIPMDPLDRYRLQQR
jgi:Ca-activated chloride channel family protein